MRLEAIAYPDAAVVAAIGLDVLRCHRPAGCRSEVTKGRTAHLLSV